MRIRASVAIFSPVCAVDGAGGGVLVPGRFAQNAALPLIIIFGLSLFNVKHRDFLQGFSCFLLYIADRMDLTTVLYIIE